jgi:hypothetical protein
MRIWTWQVAARSYLFRLPHVGGPLLPDLGSLVHLGLLHHVEQSLKPVCEVMVGARSRLVRSLVERLEEHALIFVGFERLKSGGGVSPRQHIGLEREAQLTVSPGQRSASSLSLSVSLALPLPLAFAGPCWFISQLAEVDGAGQPPLAAAVDAGWAT